jgi:UDP-N-acetylglucosamine:LPS N-acetylglucosamine transferase
MISESDLTPDALAAQITRILTAPKVAAQMAAAAHLYARLTAARDLAILAETLIKPT